MAETTWADEVVLDPKLISEAAAVRASSDAKKLKKHEVVLALSDAFGIGALRAEAALDPLSRLAVNVTPIPSPKKTDAKYEVLAKIVEQLPEDFWYARPQVVNGEQTYVSDALLKLDITPYLTALDTNPDAPKVNRGALKDIVSRVETVIASEIELQYSQAGVQPLDPQVTAAKQNRSPSTIRPMASTPPGPAAVQVGSPSGQTAATVVPMIPNQTTDFTTQAAAAVAGSATTVSPQEFLQQDAARTIQDLYNTFGNEVNLNFEGMISSGRVGDISSTALGTALNYPYQLDRDGVKRLQRTLAQAGYFDQVGNIYSTYGTVDNYTKLAWDMFLVDSVKKGVNPGKHLEERARSYAGERKALEGIQFQDQASLEAVANDLGEKLMGRRLQWGELQSFLQSIRAWETKAAAGPSYSQNTESIDISSKALQYFDREYRSEIAKTTANDLMAKLNPSYYGKVNVGG